MKLKFTFLLFLICTLQSVAQVQVTKTTDGRFIGKNIEGTVANDPIDLMSSFVIGFEWWTLTGEPLEIYEFKWNTSQYFKVGGEMLHRGALTKYPDLLKRFDALKPGSVTVTIDGMAQGGGVEVKRGKIPEYSSYLSHYDTYKKDGQSYDKYQLYREFKREIKSHKLIIEPAGKLGKDIVPGSPSWADYIEFKQWGGRDWSNTEERAKVTKYLFQLSGQLKQVKASITNITWPEGEMKAILAKYKEYEKKDNDKKEKPKKEDDFWSGNTTTDDKTTANNADDFWNGNRGKNDTPGTVTDIDGNVYKTITIGTQVWMAENLRTTRFNDGTSIPNGNGNDDWEELKTPAYCWYIYNKTNDNTYWELYNWYTVETGKLCPTGWHVPSDAEWTQLTNYLGGVDVAGGKLKEVGTAHWKSSNIGATNETGFTALPGGMRLGRHIYDVGSIGEWWSNTEGDAARAWTRNMKNFTLIVGRFRSKKELGISIRCVMD